MPIANSDPIPTVWINERNSRDTLTHARTPRENGARAFSQFYWRHAANLVSVQEDGTRGRDGEKEHDKFPRCSSRIVQGCQPSWRTRCMGIRENVLLDRSKLLIDDGIPLCEEFWEFRRFGFVWIKRHRVISLIGLWTQWYCLRKPGIFLEFFVIASSPPPATRQLPDESPLMHVSRHVVIRSMTAREVGNLGSSVNIEVRFTSSTCSSFPSLLQYSPLLSITVSVYRWWICY